MDVTPISARDFSRINDGFGFGLKRGPEMAAHFHAIADRIAAGSLSVDAVALESKAADDLVWVDLHLRLIEKL